MGKPTKCQPVGGAAEGKVDGVNGAENAVLILISAHVGKNGTRANRQTQGGECQRLTQDSGRRKVGVSWDGGGGFLGVG